jgi:Metallo-beta-lactamase superfamily
MPLEAQIDFHPVGDGERSGDAITVRYGTGNGYSIHVIDGGTEAAGQLLVQAINEHYDSPTRIDAVVCSHGDDDHTSGLRPVIDNYEIGAIYINRPWLYAQELLPHFEKDYTAEGLTRRLRQDYPILVEREETAIARGIPIFEVFQGTTIGAFTVLAPEKARYISLIPQFTRTPDAAAPDPALEPLGQIMRKIARGALSLVPETWELETLDDFAQEPTSASNESSVVQLAEFNGHRILLTGDAGVDGLSEALDFAERLGIVFPDKLKVLQVPHHGSRHNVSRPVLNRLLGAPLPQGHSRGRSRPGWWCRSCG